MRTIAKGIFIVLCVAFVGLVIMLMVAPPSPEPPEKIACNKDWHDCADNEALAAAINVTYMHARTGCKMAAESQAKYGTPQWPWFAFHAFLPGDDYIKTGKAVLIEHDAQFQNAFGAMQHVRVICTYDMTKDSDDAFALPQRNVVSVVIVPK